MRLAGLVLLVLAAGCRADGGASPSASESLAASATPGPTASASSSAEAKPDEEGYVEREGLQLTVLANVEADALFEDVKECRNSVHGFTVDFPASWFTNASPPPECSWFAGQPIGGEAAIRRVVLTRPPDVAISMYVAQTGLATTDLSTAMLREEVEVEGFHTVRSENRDRSEPPNFDYGYVVWLDLDSTGWKLIAGTSSPGHDYELNKAVLDRMMASLRFTRSEESEGAPAPDYVAVEGYPFSVLENDQADDLFATPDTCTNPEAGYEVTFPDDWYTNTEIGGTPACSWFTPEFFEVTEPGEVPQEIWISLAIVDGVIAYTGLTEIFLGEEVPVDGTPVWRVEYNPFRDRPDYRAYHYTLNVGESGSGPSFVASVEANPDDYELAKAVLDRIMALMEFEDW